MDFDLHVVRIPLGQLMVHVRDGGDLTRMEAVQLVSSGWILEDFADELAIGVRKQDRSQG